jgi:hypothetical protein
MPQAGPVGRSGTRLLIAGAVLSLTGVFSIAALVVQLMSYEPSCEPVATWSFTGACGVLRLLVLLMLPVMLVGDGLLVGGLLLRRRDRPGPPG